MGLTKKKGGIKMKTSKLNLNLKTLVLKLQNLFTCGKNSKHKSFDIASRIVQSANENRSLEEQYKLTGYLSADRVLDKLHNIEEGKPMLLVEWFNVKFLQKLLPKTITLAVDIHDRIFYGNKNHPEIIGTKGGRYARRYIEISSVKPALFINALPVNLFTNDKKTLLKWLIDSFKGHFPKTQIGLLLVDRGFFTKEVVNFLVETNQKFIMPAIKNERVKKLIGLYECGELKDKIRYKFGNVCVNLIFFPVTNKNGEKETLVYITNTKMDPIRVHLTYKKRWQIETNFREQNNFMLKTKTKDFKIRYFTFVLAGLLFNLWQLIRLILPYKLESYLFSKFLADELLRIWQETTGKEVVKSIDYLLDA